MGHALGVQARVVLELGVIRVQLGRATQAGQEDITVTRVSARSGMTELIAREAGGRQARKRQKRNWTRWARAGGTRHRQVGSAKTARRQAQRGESTRGERKGRTGVEEHKREEEGLPGEGERDDGTARELEQVRGSTRTGTGASSAGTRARRRAPSTRAGDADERETNSVRLPDHEARVMVRVAGQKTGGAPQRRTGWSPSRRQTGGAWGYVRRGERRGKTSCRPCT